MASTAAPSAPFLSPRPIQRDGGQGGGLGDPDQLHGQVAGGDLLLGHLRQDSCAVDPEACRPVRRVAGAGSRTGRGAAHVRPASLASAGHPCRRRRRDELAPPGGRARTTDGDRFEVLTPREGDGPARIGLRRHEGAGARGHRPGRRGAGPVPPDRRQPRRAAAGRGHQRGARGREPRRASCDRARSGGRRRDRGHVGRRGGPAHPPRRAAGAPALRPAAAALRHRRRLHRAADRRAGRGPRRRSASSSAPSASPTASSPERSSCTRRPCRLVPAPRPGALRRSTAPSGATRSATRSRSARRARSSRCPAGPAAAGERAAPHAQRRHAHAPSEVAGGRRGS